MKTINDENKCSNKKSIAIYPVDFFDNRRYFSEIAGSSAYTAAIIPRFADALSSLHIFEDIIRRKFFLESTFAFPTSRKRL